MSVRLIAALSGLVLLLVIIWAIAKAPIGAAVPVIAREPWWVVTLADLYIGFILASLIIFAAESDWRIALAWILPLYILGNVILAAWLLVRGYRLFPLAKHASS